MPTKKATKKQDRFVARAHYQGQTFHLGVFDTEEKARSAEERWWGNPKNVTYQAWVDRHRRMVLKRNKVAKSA